MSVIDFPKTKQTETTDKIKLLRGHRWGSRLHCPRCNSDYLHYGKVAKVPGGIAIAFTCEGCTDGRGGDGGNLELVIREDKGNTDLHWRFGPAPEGAA